MGAERCHAVCLIHVCMCGRVEPKQVLQSFEHNDCPLRVNLRAIMRKITEVPDQKRSHAGWLCGSCLWKLCGCESYPCLTDAAAPGLAEERMGDCLKAWWPLCPASQLGWLHRSNSRSWQPLQSCSWSLTALSVERKKKKMQLFKTTTKKPLSSVAIQPAD